MRKLTLLAVAFLTAQLGFSQKGIELGVEFTPGISAILNDEDFARGRDAGGDDYLNFNAGTFGFNTGLTVGYNFNDGLGVVSGILYSQQGQNYVTNVSLSAGEEQSTFNRTINYVRLPLFLKINSDPTASAGSYFRFGPHFDFLTDARYSYDSKNIKTDLLNYQRSEVSLKNDADYKDFNMYNSFVFGITLEFGGFVRINDNMKITYMLSICGNLNSEGEGVKDYLNSSNQSVLGVPGPRPLMYAIDNNTRKEAFNVFGGLNIGFKYAIPMN
jgi:hypothetical protein